MRSAALPVLPPDGPDCVTFPCDDACCRHGVDVWPDELERLVTAGLATHDDFQGPITDEVGDVLYRTRLGERGCVFLRPDRGCRFHGTAWKPRVCIDVPRDREDLEVMELPCLAEWRSIR